MAYTFYNSEVIDIIDETHNVKRFFFKVPEFESFDFFAGQFVMLDLPLNSKVNTRAYSIASAPDGSNVFELIIVLKEDGLGTPYIWKNITVGSQVPVSSVVKRSAQSLGDFQNGISYPRNAFSRIALSVVTGEMASPSIFT